MKKQRLRIEEVQQLPQYHREVIPNEYIDHLGHLNVKWYFHMFGKAAMTLIPSIGYTGDRITEKKQGTFVLTHIIKYLAEIREGHTVSVHGRILGRSEKKMHKMYFIANEDRQNVAATLEVLNCNIDLEHRRSAPFPDDIAANIDAMLESHRALDWFPPVSGILNQ